MGRRWVPLFALAAVCGTVVVPALVAAPAGAAPVEDVDFRRITFPVEGSTRYSDDFAAPRVGHTHQGNDIMGTKLQHEVAVRDGTVTFLRSDSSGTSGNMLTLTDSDGWFYYYIHVNNDGPGTDDNTNPDAFRFAPGITVGSKVKAGQFLAYMGDSGDAETTAPHLHFEIHKPDRSVINPYPSLRLAQGFAVNGRCRYDDNPKGLPSPASGPGYYALGSDGGVFTFGDAPFLGSTGAMKLNQPVVSMATNPAGRGYWLVARDGGIFTFGDAAFHGSTGAMKLNQPIVGMTPTPSGRGYWLVARDGGIFTFGDAVFYGSLPGTGLCTLPAATTIVASRTGRGYWIEGVDGSTWTFGDSRHLGAVNALPVTPNAPTISLAVAASTPNG